MGAILGVSGLKQEQKGMKRVPPTHPQPQASSHPLLNKEGSAICDWFLELFSERRSFRHVRTQHLSFPEVKLILQSALVR